MGKLDTAASTADALELKGSPESERQTVDPAYRNHLVLAEQKSQDDFDKTVLSLSGGALGISFAFVKDMIGENPIVHPTWLWLSWVIWAFSSLAVLASFFMSHLALREAIAQCDNGTIHHKKPGGVFATLTQVLNASGALLFVAGVCFMAAFVNVNLTQREPEDVREEASIPSTAEAPVPTSQEGRQRRYPGPQP